jgi:hypothetical protein
MGRHLNPDIAYRKILKAKGPTRTKVRALLAMGKPSRRLLEWLIHDPGTHGKIRLLAGKRLAELEEARSGVPGAKEPVPASVAGHLQNISPEMVLSLGISVGPNAEPLPANKNATLWAATEFRKWHKSHFAKVETDSVRKTNRDGSEAGSQPGAPSGNLAPADQSVAISVLSRSAEGASSSAIPTAIGHVLPCLPDCPRCLSDAWGSPAKAAIKASQAQAALDSGKPIASKSPPAERAAVPASDSRLTAQLCLERGDWQRQQRQMGREQRRLTREMLENEKQGGYEINLGPYPTSPPPEPKPVRRTDWSQWVDPRFAQPDFGQGGSPVRLQQEPEFSRPYPTASGMRRELIKLAQELAQKKSEGDESDL